VLYDVFQPGLFPWEAGIWLRWLEHGASVGGLSMVHL